MGILSERRALSPYGMSGGEPGSRGVNLFRRHGTDHYISIGGKASLHVDPGDVVRIETPGGGGYGMFPHKNVEV